MAFKALFKSKNKPEEYPKFTNFTVDIKGDWNTLEKIEKSVDIISYNMGDGKLNISGFTHPKKFMKNMKKAGKKPEDIHWEYGICSSHLYKKTKTETPSNNNMHPGHGGYNGGYYGYPTFQINDRPFSHPECYEQHIQQNPQQSSSSSFQELASDEKERESVSNSKTRGGSRHKRILGKLF